MRTAARARLLLPGLWAGLLLAVALIAAPTAFAVLARADAARVAARLFAQEAYMSLALGIVLLLLERRTAQTRAEAGAGSLFSTSMALLLGTLFCTVAGYFALQPMMEAARAGRGPLSFIALHGISTAFYALKGLLVLTLAWRAAGEGRLRSPSS